jgi:putative hydrolase of HD superfamily
MKDLMRFLYELGQLKHVPRSGWGLLGVTLPESVAEHTARTAQVAYVLAILEKNAEPERVATMALFHDIAECRVTDLHKVAQRYVRSDEQSAVRGMMSSLGTPGKKIEKLWNEMHAKKTSSARIAKDADLLEVALSAREYETMGYADARDWYQNAGRSLHSESAKELWTLMGSADPNAWWKGLKKFT